MTNFSIFIIYATVSAFGLYFLKISNLRLNIKFIVGLTLYGVGFVIWLIILRYNKLSVAFPIASSMLVVALQIFGFYLLNEKLTISKLLGILFIMIGITILHLDGGK